jgi:hypothetical protein
MRSGRNSASAGRKAETDARALIPQRDLLRKRGCDGEQHRNRLPKKAFPGYPSLGGAMRPRAIFQSQ